MRNFGVQRIASSCSVTTSEQTRAKRWLCSMRSLLRSLGYVTAIKLTMLQYRPHLFLRQINTTVTASSKHDLEKTSVAWLLAWNNGRSELRSSHEPKAMLYLSVAPTRISKRTMPC